MAERLNPNSHLRNLLVTPEVINYTEDITIQSRLIIGGSALSLASEISSLTIDTVRTGDIHDTSKELISALSTQERSLSTDMTSWIEGVKNYIQSVSNDERSKQILLRLGINASGFNNEDALAFYDKFCNNDQFANIDTFVNSVIESYRNESYSVLAQDLPKLQEIANIYGSEASNFIIQRISIKKKLEDEEGKKRFIEVANEKDENGKLKINIFNTQQENFLNPLVAITEKINIPSLPKQDVVGENNVQEEQPVPIKPTSFFNRLKSSVANAQLSRKELREKKRLAKETARDDAQKKLLSRRGFLKAVGGGLASLVVYTGADAEVRAGIEAAFSRPGPDEENNPKLEMSIVSDEMLKKTWETHFKGREHVMSLEAWARRQNFEKGQWTDGNGVNLATLANLYYTKERGKDESFDDYFERFVDKMHTIADRTGLDFIVLTSTLQVSAENIRNLSEQNTDLKISQIQQAAVPIARRFGLEQQFLDTLGRNGLAVQAWNKIDELRGIDPFMRKGLPAGGIWDYDLIRMGGQVTTGMMDYEPGEKANSFIQHIDTDAAKDLITSYPEVINAFLNASKIRHELDTIRDALQRNVTEYIQKFTSSLDDLANADESVLEVLGLGDNLDSWQLTHWTIAWCEQIQIPNNNDSIKLKIVNTIKEEVKKDKIDFLIRFVSQQLHNPKFIQYLESKAIQNGNIEEENKVKQLSELIDKDEMKAKELRISYDKVSAAEGPLEYDSKYQLLTSALLTRMLSDKSGEFNPNDKNNLYWHIYKTTAIREMAAPYVLVNSKPFARDPSVDHPYAPEDTLVYLNKFADLLLQKGILVKSPKEDVEALHTAIDNIRWRFKGAYPALQDSDWNELVSFMEKYLITRLYIDESNLLKTDVGKGLTEMLSKKGLIHRLPIEDKIPFYEVVNNLFGNRWDLYPQLNEQDKIEIQQYLEQKVKPIVYTQSPSGSSADVQRALLGQREYPPIVRSEGVLWNLITQ